MDETDENLPSLRRGSHGLNAQVWVIACLKLRKVVENERKRVVDAK